MDYFLRIENSFEIQYMDYNSCLYTNGALYEPSPRQENRDLIYSHIDTMAFESLVKKYFNMPNQLGVKIKSILPQSIKNRLKLLVKNKCMV